MKAKITKLEILLTELIGEINHRIYVENNIEELIKVQERLEAPKEYYESLRAEIYDEYVGENSRLLHEIHIPKMRLLMMEAFDKLNTISAIEKEKNERLSRGFNLTPNQEFKILLEKKLLTTEQDIFGTFKKQTIIGHITADGFFNLKINGKITAFSDLKTAILFGWNKLVPNDGWGHWSTMDYRTGETRNLKDYRNLLRQIR